MTPSFYQNLQLLAIGCSLLFFGFYAGYLLVCLKYRSKNEDPPNGGFTPPLSVIVPTYNEADQIPSKIENLRSIVYPKDKLDVVFVDGASTDGTAQIAEDLGSKIKAPRIKVIRQEIRRGFNNAIIEAFPATKGDIICITGAETEYAPEALKTMAAHFSEPRVGAVTGRQKLRPKKGYGLRLEGAYRDLYDIIREAESNICSVFDIKGEISAVRRDILAHLVSNPHLANKGCIDGCISFQAEKDGYRAIYEPNAVYYDFAPGTVRDSLRQQARHAAILIQNMMAFKTMTFQRKYRSFGMLIMPAHFLMLLILPFVLLLAIASTLSLIVLNLPNVFLIGSVASVLIAILLSRHLQAFLETQLSLVIAVVHLIFGIDTQNITRLASVRG